MKEIISNYWLELVIVLISIISVVVGCIRMKPSKAVDQVKNLISEVLPGFINLAEISGCHGKAKLLFVVESILKRIRKYISKEDEDYWMQYITDQVEAILSTPQKKEVQ